MQRTRRLLIIGGTVAAVAAGTGTAVALGGGDADRGDDGDRQATGSGADGARDAALAITKGGRPTRSSATPRTARHGRSRSRGPRKTVDVRSTSTKLVVVESDSERE